MEKSISTPTTLKHIVDTALQQRGMSRSDLVKAIGYSNTSKGLRKLDNYLSTITAPSDKFVRSLIGLLGIDALTFYKAVRASKEVRDKALMTEAKRTFRPSLLLLTDLQPRPWFAAQVLCQMCTVEISRDIQRLTFKDEIDAVICSYKERLKQLDFKDTVTGFKYYREHNYFISFNKELAVTNIATSTFIQKRKLLGNQIINLVST